MSAAYDMAIVRALRLVILAGLFALTGCSMGTVPISSTATVQDYFFPLQNGLVYSYSRFETGLNQNIYDTVACRLVIGQTMADKNALVDTKTGNVLFFIGFTHDANNNLAATLSTGDTTLLALDGVLEDSATWVADPIHHIRATVIGRYDDYYLPPNRTVHFSDVVVIQYHRDGDDASVYTLRFFANGHGLIREATFAGGNTEIGHLQVLGIQYPS
ncbi:MAG: hypothetical protein Q8922_04820 [Bacteroidota bacterium]|nr:hypothetical protein [Bacteroidota bacterium]MDP4231972.1 hypothetical protein [Bacteroidota bacterium]MDP4241321.1 hypothetical protein [Bacteroidota bacterium]MDP4287242.1 hypothetical protein [Bacteroidota bacterium]